MRSGTINYLHQLAERLTELGLSCEVGGNYLIMLLKWEHKQIAAGIRCHSDGMRFAAAWPDSVPMNRINHIRFELLWLNRRLPSGQWVMDQADHSLAFEASLTARVYPAYDKDRLLTTVRTHLRLVLICAGNIAAAIEGPGRKWPVSQRMDQCQPQLEALPPEEQLTTEQWEAVQLALAK